MFTNLNISFRSPEIMAGVVAMASVIEDFDTQVEIIISLLEVVLS